MSKITGNIIINNPNNGGQFEAALTATAGPVNLAADFLQLTLVIPANTPAGTYNFQTVVPPVVAPKPPLPTPTPTPAPSPTPTPTPTPPPNPGGGPVPVITVTSPPALPLETVNVNAAIATNFGAYNARDCIINWDFGDTLGSFNNLRGYNAQHSYPAAGTYTIICTIITPDGKSGSSSKTITIAQDTRPTTLISTVAQIPAKPSNNTIYEFGNGTFDWSGNTLIDLTGCSHVLLKGSGATFYYTGPQAAVDTITMPATTQSIVVQGITFDSKYPNVSATTPLPTASSPKGNGLAFIDCTFGNLGDDLNQNGNPTNLLVQACTSNNPSGYFAWIQGQNLAYLGNKVNNSQWQALFRIGQLTTPVPQYILSAFNDFTNTTIIKGYATPKNCMSIQWSDSFYSYMDTINGGQIQLGPIGDSSSGDNPAGETTNAVIDSLTVNQAQIQISPQTINCVIRNPVIIQTKGSFNNAAFSIDSTQIGGGFNWQVNGVEIQNATYDSSNANAMFLQVQNGNPQNVSFSSCLTMTPNMVISQNGAIVRVWEATMEGITFHNDIYGQIQPINQYYNDGMFYVGTGQSNQPGWQDGAQWDQSTNSGDQANIPVTYNAGNYTATSKGVTAGSTLPRATNAAGQLAGSSLGKN